VHDSVDGRCLIRVGDAILPPASLDDGEPACFTPAAPEGPLRALEPGPTPPHLKPPESPKCDRAVPVTDTPHRKFRVILEFVVGVTGAPEPRTLRVLESSGLEDAAAATYVVGTCRYVPGKIAGDAVRVLVRQPLIMQ
jgi:hypothetical protein